MCVTDSSFFNHDQVGTIARCGLAAWDGSVNATFLWTAHNEIEEKWDYVKAWDLGWINKTALSPMQEANIAQYKVLEEAGKLGITQVENGELSFVGGVHKTESFLSLIYKFFDKIYY